MEKAEMPELLPCPFCGSQAESNNEPDNEQVGCSNYNCIMLSIDFSVEEWNTRADLAQSQAGRDVEKAFDDIHDALGSLEPEKVSEGFSALTVLKSALQPPAQGEVASALQTDVYGVEAESMDEIYHLLRQADNALAGEVLVREYVRKAFRRLKTVMGKN